MFECASLHQVRWCTRKENNSLRPGCCWKKKMGSSSNQRTTAAKTSRKKWIFLFCFKRHRCYFNSFYWSKNGKGFIVKLRIWVQKEKRTSFSRVNIHHKTQGPKKIIFTACHSGKLKLACTSPDVISTSPKSLLMSRIDFTVLVIRIPQTHHLPVGQVKNKIH